MTAASWACGTERRDGRYRWAGGLPYLPIVALAGATGTKGPRLAVRWDREAETVADLRVEVDEARQSIRVGRASGQHLLTHRVPPDARPTIHPIMAPDGVGELTQDGPDHHPWQHGLYTGFNIVNGAGFWRDEPGDGSFRPVLVGEPESVDSTARWEIRTSWRMPDGSLALDERQRWTLVDYGSTVELDLGWDLGAVPDVTIGQFMAGGLFLRMPFVPALGGDAVNDRGQHWRDAERQRANWVAVSMPIRGRSEWAGAVLMDHPTNPDHPVTWRVDNELGVSPSRCIAGPWTIRAGTVERYRFRLAFFTGGFDPAWAGRRWDAFASSP